LLVASAWLPIIMKKNNIKPYLLIVPNMYYRMKLGISGNTWYPATGKGHQTCSFTFASIRNGIMHPGWRGVS
jgi:hypothetical protein